MGSLFCDPCKYLKNSKQAVKHCQICRESYCQRCADVHMSSKATKDHLLLTIRDSFTIVRFHDELNAVHTCSRHGKTFDFYCKEHDAFLCSTCVLSRSHATCNCVHSELVDISFAGQKLAEINFSETVDEEMKNVIDQAEDSIKSIGNAMVKSMQSKANMSEQMKLFVDSLQSFVDAVRVQAAQIEEVTEHQCNSHEKTCLKTVSDLESLKKSAEDCSKLSDLFNTIGSPADIFRSAFVIKQRCKKFIEDMETIKDDAAVLQVVVEKSAIVSQLEQSNKPLFRCKTSKIDVRLESLSIRETFTQTFESALSEGDQNQPFVLDRRPLEPYVDGQDTCNNTINEYTEQSDVNQLNNDQDIEEIRDANNDSNSNEHQRLQSHSMESSTQSAVNRNEVGSEILEEESNSSYIHQQNNESDISGVIANDGNMEIVDGQASVDLNTRQSLLERMMLSSDVHVPENSTEKIDTPATYSLYPECPTDMVYLKCIDVSQTLRSAPPKFESVMCLFDERLVLSDSENMRLIILDRSGRILSQLFVPFIPYCLNYISKTRLAVSIKNDRDNRFAFVKIKGFNTKDIHYIKTRFLTKSIRSISADKLLVTMIDRNDNWHIDVIHTNGTRLKTFKTDEFYNYHFAAVQLHTGQEGNYQIIYVSELFGKMKCIDSKGHFVFNFDVSEVTDIVTDKRGFIYTICMSRVIVLTPHGDCCMTKEFEEIRRPKRATFSPSYDRLYITTDISSQIHVLDVQRLVWRTA